MRLLLAALCCCIVACANDEDGRTTGDPTLVTSVGSATHPATTGGEPSTGGATTGAPDPGTTGDPTGDPTPDPITTTTAASLTTTTPDPDTTDPSTTTAGSTGGEPDPLACPPQLALDCEPGPGSGEPDTCAKGTSCFLELVQEGVQDVIAMNPAWFTDEGGGAYLVLDVDAFMNAVVADINEHDLCAIRDPNAGDEVAVKHDNGYAESFDILSADGHARYGELIYTATCAPAWY